MIPHFHSWFDGAGSLAQTMVGVGLLTALLAVAFVLWRAARGLRGAKPENVLTVVAAAMATSVASTGMWHFFERTLQLPAGLRAVLFAFMEVAVLAEALRARANVKAFGEAGLDGKAVWVLTILSGSMSATEAGSVRASIVRFTSPLVAAWLWERSLVPERRAARPQRSETIRWIFDVRRLAVQLGLATAMGSDLEAADANARIDRYMRAIERAAIAGWITRRWRSRQAARAKSRLMQQARLNADPRALFSHLGEKAILEVLATLGGADAVLSSDRAAQLAAVLGEKQMTNENIDTAPEKQPAENEAGEERETEPTLAAESAAWIPEQRPGGTMAVAGGLGASPSAASAADGEQGADVSAAPRPGALPESVGRQLPVLPESAESREAAAGEVLPGSAGGVGDEQGNGGGDAGVGERATGRRRASTRKDYREQVLTALVTMARSGQSEPPSGRQLRNIVGGRWDTVTSALDDLGGPEQAWETALTQAREPVPADR